jgi:hypothetical protein
MLIHLHVSAVTAQFVPDNAAYIRPFGHKQASLAFGLFTVPVVGIVGKSWNTIFLPSNTN